jgi:DNA-binding NarL/FixJ family response regulator
MEQLRILLVDDHILFRKGLAQLLDAQPDFDVVGEAENGQSAVDQALALKPDLVLMDLRMPVRDGINATRQIKRELPSTQVVILTVSEEDHDLYAAIQSGANGYLVKDLRPEELFQELRGLIRGETPLSRVMTGKLLRYVAEQNRIAPPLAAFGSISSREGEVLALIVDGLSNVEIASRLGISVNTVRNHVCSILEKLGARNRVQAAVYAVRSGLFEPEAEVE